MMRMDRGQAPDQDFNLKRGVSPFFVGTLMTDHIVYCFGRYNPPTQGHITHFTAVKLLAAREGADHCVYVSPTVDSQKNPISPEDKIEYIAQAAPSLVLAQAKNMFAVLDELVEKKYTKATYVAGADYFDESSDDFKMLQRLQKAAAAKGITVDVRISGDRQPGVSGTDLRNAVINNNFGEFAAISPANLSTSSIRQMFEKCREKLL